MTNHTASATCTICADTGIDLTFGGACTFCTEAGLAAVKAAGLDFMVRGMGECTDHHHHGNGAGRRSSTPAAAKPARTNKYAATCADCGNQVPAETGVLTNEKGKWVVRHNGACPAVKAPAAPAAPKADTTGLDLSHVPSGRYIAPGGTRKFTVDNVDKGKWAGFTFVRNGSEYGAGNRYGMQKPQGFYNGQHAEELAVIAADPKAAAIEYGKQTGSCAMCGRTLENEDSVAAGIGPVCRSRAGW